MLSKWADYDNGLPVVLDTGRISMESGWPQPLYSPSLISQICLWKEPGRPYWCRLLVPMLFRYSLHTSRANLNLYLLATVRCMQQICITAEMRKKRVILRHPSRAWWKRIMWLLRLAVSSRTMHILKINTFQFTDWITRDKCWSVATNSHTNLSWI